MEGFEDFINTIVDKWRKDKFSVYEKKGLGVPANRIMGDWAEKNVFLKIEKLKPKYIVILSKGSQTPSDIFSICHRKGFYHLMLNQVKSTTSPGKYFELSDDDLKRYGEFGKWFRKEANKFELLKGKPFVVTLGYVLVYNRERNNRIESAIMKTVVYKNAYFCNANDLDKRIAVNLVIKAQDAILNKQK